MKNFKTIPKRITSNWLENYFIKKKSKENPFWCSLEKLRDKNENIQFQKSYTKWKKEFEKIFSEDEITQSLFLNHIYLSIIVEIIVYYILQNNGHKIITKTDVKRILKFPKYLSKISEDTQIKDLKNALIKKMVQKAVKISKGDLFSNIYQKLLSFEKRHHRGEFYTHPILARLMVKEGYNFGEKVLDPTCGSGTFLYEISNKIFSSKSNNLITKDKRIKAHLNLYGFDINPLACFMARANLIKIFLEYYPQKEMKNTQIDKILHKISNNIVQLNSLFPEEFQSYKEEKFQNKFDLVIGNPPWVVLNKIPLATQKRKIKELGNEMNIIRGGRLSSTTELTTIFCYKSIYEFLKDKGIIFVVTPASLANASQHSIFRQFANLEEIEFWKFKQDVFRIHNLCFKAKKSNNCESNNIETDKFRNKEIKWKTFQCELEPLKLELLKEECYVPTYIKINEKKKQKHIKRKKKKHLKKKNTSENLEVKPKKYIHVGRLISKSQKKEYPLLNHYKKSDYKKDFRQGASIVPRNLLFIDKIKKKKTKNKGEEHNSIISIKPSKYIRSKKYGRWGFQAYEASKVERDYIFQVAKSTGLLPFNYYRTYDVFLPLEKNGNLNKYVKNKKDTKYSIKTPNKKWARKHYQLLQNQYQKHRKKSARITNLKDRLNYGHALTNPLQFQELKIIYAGIGSIVKAAIINGTQILIDTSLYYYVPKSLKEAYYLMGYLNSSILTEHLKVVGSTGASGSLRNIHKHPFKFKFPDFAPENPTHLKLAKQSKNMEGLTNKIIINLIEKNKNLKEKPKSIQNRIYKNPQYQKERKKLDNLVIKLFP